MARTYILLREFHKTIKSNSRIFSLYQAIACLSVKKAIQELIPEIKLSIKYPNDVYAFEGSIYKKISGALIEQGFIGQKLDYTIIGIGVNVEQKEFPKELVEKATSISLLGLKINTVELAEKMDDHINSYLVEDESEIFLEWSEQLNIMNKEIEVEGKGKWSVEEFLEDGRLSLKRDNENIIIDNGDSVRYQLG